MDCLWEECCLFLLSSQFGLVCLSVSGSPSLHLACLCGGGGLNSIKKWTIWGEQSPSSLEGLCVPSRDERIGTVRIEGGGIITIMMIIELACKFNTPAMACVCCGGPIPLGTTQVSYIRKHTDTDTDTHMLEDYARSGLFSASLMKAALFEGQSLWTGAGRQWLRRRRRRSE